MIKKDVDKLKVKILPNRKEMGKISHEDFAETVKKLLKEKETISIIFAAAPSQNDFLERITSDKDIDYTKIIAYHMDEYIGLPKNHEAGFGNFLNRSLFSKCPFKEVHYINGNTKSPEEECERYSKLLNSTHIDIVCMGVGQNGHIAFNDPAEADFNDPNTVKVVKLDEICRQQQVNDGCFKNINEVPKHAFTVTIPALMKADYHFCIVPTKLKANAIKKMLEETISKDCPASILRTKINSILYLDADAASLLNKAK